MNKLNTVYEWYQPQNNDATQYIIWTKTGNLIFNYKKQLRYMNLNASFASQNCKLWNETDLPVEEFLTEDVKIKIL